MEEELKATHKKEIRSFEGEKRNALKKLKSTAGKGKKGKEVMAKAEAEWNEKEKAMLEKHSNELAAISSSTNDNDNNDNDSKQTNESDPKIIEEQESSTTTIEEPQLTAKQKAMAKKAKKRQAERDQQRAEEAKRAEELANAGPSARDVELQNIMHNLSLSCKSNNSSTKQRMEIEEIQADGNCLYRAIATQLIRLSSSSGHKHEEFIKEGYVGMRKLCADALAAHKDEFEPFCDLEGMSSFDEYVGMVRDSSEWGGHLELRALATSLEKTIVVYSADALPLYIVGVGSDESEKGGEDGEDLIRLSFHRDYYALGEHYNSVVVVNQD